MSVLPLHFGRLTLGQTLRLATRRTKPSGCPIKSPFLTGHSPQNKLGSHVDNFPRRSFTNSPRSQDSPKYLMDHPRVVPDVLSSSLNFLRNKFFQQYIITRYDAGFSVEEFKKGATAALLLVSGFLASDDVTPLQRNGLVEPAAYEEIKRNHGRMDVQQRRGFQIGERDIRHKHLYRIGVIEDDDTGLKAVEIMMVFAIMDAEIKPPDSPLSLIDNVMICNYRFYRDYTNKNNPSDWILNVVNQFYLKDLKK